MRFGKNYRLSENKDTNSGTNDSHGNFLKSKWSTILTIILQVWPVFEHCDVDKKGLISINHLIELCKEHGQVDIQ